MSAYPISSPVEFTNTSAGDSLNFNADGPSAATKSQISNFVTSSPGDILYRQTDGTGNLLEKLTIGSTGEVLQVTGTPIAEISTVTTVADTAGSLNNTYFLLNSPTTAYYFWYDVSGGGTDPGTVSPIPADLFINDSLKTGVTVAITTGDSASSVATTTDGVISGLSDFGTVLAAPLITITNAAVGAADDAADGTSATGFTIATTTPGVSSAPVWGAVPTSVSTETFHAVATVQGANTVSAGSAWVALSPAAGAGPVTWDDSTTPNHDAGTSFDTTTGIFTVPTTGIWQISSSVQFEGNATGNRGGGITGRRAVRQARYRKSNANAFTVTCEEYEAQASANNPTMVSLSSACVSLTSSDTVRVEVRHDANTSIQILSEEDGTPTTGPSTYFSAHRFA